MTTMPAFRIEKDALGEVRVPASAYYGAHTARALENFPISGIRHSLVFVRAMGYIKKAAARANARLGCIQKRIADAIVAAADRVIAGDLRDQFVVDVYQAGAGTSFHMNVNEVMANLANEILGGKKGEYRPVHPNDHVNYGQSTNDVFPTAMRIAALLMLRELAPVVKELAASLARKARQFDKIIKSGRTHLQDAAPVRLGQEFSGYARAIEKSLAGLDAAAKSLQELGIGGSAVGTGLNTHPGYAKTVVKDLSALTGLDLRPSPNRFEAMQSNACFVRVSGALRELALELIRIANDLRLLSSGPNTGLAEINLPGTQPGSSIMPGKVNPVMAEMMNMVCFAVVGNDLTISMAAQAGQLELNVMMPVIACKLLDSIEILINAVLMFTVKCVEGIAADAKRCEAYAMRSLSIVTALNPFIGYAKAAEVAKQSLATGRTIRDIVLAKKLMTRARLDEVLNLIAMTEPRAPKRRPRG
jgi:fumarate hydratase class II/aspartate ammonia-lyase